MPLTPAAFVKGAHKGRPYIFGPCTVAWPLHFAHGVRPYI